MEADLEKIDSGKLFPHKERRRSKNMHLILDRQPGVNSQGNQRFKTNAKTKLQKKIAEVQNGKVWFRNPQDRQTEKSVQKIDDAEERVWKGNCGSNG